MEIIKVHNPVITELKRIHLPDGDVLHAIRKSDPTFVGFGEAYFSCVNEGSIKAWKKHKKMTLNLVVPIGHIRFVFLIDAEKGVFQTEDIGENKYVRITVAPDTWFGFKGLGPGPSLVMNLANIEHDPDEVERCENLKFDYKW